MPPEVEEQTDDQSEEEDSRLADLIGGLETRLVERLEGSLSEKLEKRFDSIADRRVNAILNEVRKQQQPSGEQNPTPPAPNGGNDRMRRATLKSAIQSELVMRELTTDEKRMAQDMAFSQAEYRSIGEGDDEFVIATQVVDSVVKVLHGARDTYQAQLREELESRGVRLDDEEKQPGRKPKPKANNDQQQLDKGAERARALGLA